MRNCIIVITTILALISCKEDVLPKPKGFLRLTYPTATYKTVREIKPYIFEAAGSTTILKQPNYWVKIQYPSLKASINITYRPVEDNLIELLTESEKLVFKHTIKADQILTKDFINDEKRVFGSMYEIYGNAASQIQFHLTDSTSHFIKGALYFYAKPNYDSILPAVHYIKKDIVRFIETIEWRGN